MPEELRGSRPPLDSTQQPLFDALKARGIHGMSILEIGCGDGRLHRRMLEEGATSAVGVELQANYIEKAERLAREEGVADRVTYYREDFMELVDQIEPADLVILDKVVHCTHDPERLIRLSTAHTRSVYAIAFPAPRPLLRTSMWLLGPLLRLMLPFRVRFSPPERVRQWIRENGFERVSRQDSEMWHVEIYNRTMNPEAGERVTISKEALA